MYQTGVSYQLSVVFIDSTGVTSVKSEVFFNRQTHRGGGCGFLSSVTIYMGQRDCVKTLLQISTRSVARG